jgi:hypothetical protein
VTRELGNGVHIKTEEDWRDYSSLCYSSPFREKGRCGSLKRLHKNKKSLVTPDKMGTLGC